MFDGTCFCHNPVSVFWIESGINFESLNFESSGKFLDKWNFKASRLTAPFIPAVAMVMTSALNVPPLELSSVISVVVDD